MLTLTEPQTAPRLYKSESTCLKSQTCVSDFSYFSKPVHNVIPVSTMSVKDAFEYITNEQNAHPTRVLRSITDKDKARNYKAHHFNFACFSGIFTRRSEAGLVQHSNLLTADIDHIIKPNKLRDYLIDNTNFETVLAFVSPSGDGLKWIIKIDLNILTHLQWFLALENYIKTNYRLEIDKSGKDVSRCCFLPYDETAYINPKYLS